MSRFIAILYKYVIVFCLTNPNIYAHRRGFGPAINTYHTSSFQKLLGYSLLSGGFNLIFIKLASKQDTTISRTDPARSDFFFVFS